MVEDYCRSWFDVWVFYFSSEGIPIKVSIDTNRLITSQLEHFISLLCATTTLDGFDINSTHVNQMLVSLQKSLDILPKIITKCLISYEKVLEYIDIYFLCLHCFDLITLELKDDPFVEINYQRKIYVDCLKYWGLYKEGGSNEDSNNDGSVKSVVKGESSAASVSNNAEQDGSVNGSHEKDSELADVAAVSAGNNHEVGQMITEALSRVGRKGVVTLEEGKSAENSLYIAEGMQFDHGYISPYFVTNRGKMTVEYENCKLLLVDKKITNARDLISVLEDAIRGAYPVLIIAEDIEQEALGTLVVNKLRGALKVAALKAPGFGERRSQYLDDIATSTGATVIREEIGLTLDKADKDVLGHAAKVVLTKDTTTIVGDRSTQDVVNKRVAQIKNRIQVADQDYEKEKLNERIAKISGGVVVIQVGAQTETELSLRKLELQSLQKEKSERMKQILEHLDCLYSLCSVLGSDFKQTISEIHPSLCESEGLRNISDDTLEKLGMAKQKLREVKLQRMLQLQDLGVSLLKLVLKKKAKLENICRKTHLIPDSDSSFDIVIDILESGAVDACLVLEQIELQISKVKEEAPCRKEILVKIEKWMGAYEEESWLEEYNRYNAGRGAHLTLKRAEKARALIIKIPAMVDTLTAKTIAWENENTIEFTYDGVQLLTMLEGYMVLREIWDLELAMSYFRVWDLISKYGKRFVTSEVKLRQTSFEIWVEFAAKRGDVVSLWKIEKWRAETMKRHSLSTGFSCAKGFLLDHKSERAAAIIQELSQSVSDARRPKIEVKLQNLASEWSLELIKQQSEDNKKTFADTLQTDISGMIDSLSNLGVKTNVIVETLLEKALIEAYLAAIKRPIVFIICVEETKIHPQIFGRIKKREPFVYKFYLKVAQNIVWDAGGKFSSNRVTYYHLKQPWKTGILSRNNFQHSHSLEDMTVLRGRHCHELNLFQFTLYSRVSYL